MGDFLASSAHPRDTLTPLWAGVDEAGRGCLAGPVVAACVAFASEHLHAGLPPFLRDSKTLTPVQREHTCRWIYRHAAAVSVGLATVDEIERLNILRASLLAMRRAVAAVDLPLQQVLVDGVSLPEGLPCPAQAVIDGDHRVPLISAASIVAKVVRDHLMERLHQLFPQYGFAQHKGYGTRQHRQAIARFGLCPLHRPSFCTRLLSLPLEEPLG